MKYYLKEVTEDGFVEFLLNPFERLAYMGDLLIQKYPKNPQVDDFYLANTESSQLIKLGNIVYKTNDVILYNAYKLSPSMINKAPFSTALDLQAKLEEEILLAVEDVRKNRLDEVRSLEKYKETYDSYKKDHFNSIIFSKLGTTPVSFGNYNKTNERIHEYVTNIQCDEFAEAKAGLIDLVSPIVTKLMNSINFIVYEALMDDLEKEADAYIAAEKFSKRELILIDMLNKIKEAEALSFFAITRTGNMMLCKRAIDHNGKLMSKDGTETIIDIENVERIRHGGRYIYQKKITL